MSAVNAGLDKKLFAYLVKSIKNTDFYKLLGVELAELAPGHAKIKVVSGQQHTNPMGLIHGGLVVSVADAAMGNAVRSLAVTAVTVDLSTAFMSGAQLGDNIVAHGKVLKSGKSMIFAEALVYAGDSLIAHSKGTFFKIADLKY